jgi:hypothetical protein
MVSTQPSSQAEQIASNTWLGPHGGCIFADGPNAGTSAAATVHQVSMHQNITPLRVTRSSRASSRARIGSTTIVQSNSSSARSFALRTRIRRINRRRDRQKRCRQTGQRCFTISGCSLASDLGVTGAGRVRLARGRSPHVVFRRARGPIGDWSVSSPATKNNVGR